MDGRAGRAAEAPASERRTQGARDRTAGSWRRRRGSRRRRRDERGALTLFFACLLSALLFCQFLLLAGVKTRYLEARAVTLAATEGERALARFDPELYERFGLWGFRAADVEKLPEDAAVRRHLSQVPDSGPLSLTASERLGEAKNLRPQIIHFMKPRFPLLAFETVKQMRASLDEAGSSEAVGALSARLVEPERKEKLEKLRGWLSGGGADKADSKETELPETLDKRDEKAALSSLKNLLEEQVYVPLDLGQDGGTIAATDSDALSNLARQVRTLFTYDSGTGYERLLLNEYALRMFPARVHRLKLPEDYPIQESPRGLNLARVTEGDASGQLEYLLGGMAKHEKNENHVAAYLFAARFLCSLYDGLTDEAYMLRLRATARTVSVAVAALSLGTIVIPSEVIADTILSVKALLTAGKEQKSLLRGESLPLFPRKEQLAIRACYHDYVRLFLLCVPENVLLERLGLAIEGPEPNAHFTQVNVSLHWGNPYWPMQRETVSNERRYAVYARKDQE